VLHFHLLDFAFLLGFSEMAASSSECGRQAAGLHAAAAEFGNAHHQRPGSAELYRQTGSLVGHRNSFSLLFLFQIISFSLFTALLGNF
jgi:hypothetical protein